MAESRHQCHQEGRLATLEANDLHQEQQTGEHHKTLYGNGESGLKIRMDRLETWQKEMQQTMKEDRLFKNQVRAGLIIIIITALINLIERAPWHLLTPHAK